jgi:hypothetical protein
MSLRKLSGAAAAGSRDAYATGTTPTTTSGNGNGNAGSSAANVASSGGPGGSSKAYSTHLAVQSDAAKYRGKYKELKKKVRQIEVENDRLHLKTLRIKRNIQRMRLERAILYERLEAELSFNDGLQDNAKDGALADASAGQRTTPPPTESRGHAVAADRRNLDYSPSPESERPSRPPVSTATAKAEQPARASMKITLKRHSNAASHQQNGAKDS